MGSSPKSSPDDFACYCNQVSWREVDDAIRQGARTLTQIYDACQAGTGPCGGSCRTSLVRRIQALTAAPDSPESLVPHAADPPEVLVKAVSLFNRRYYWETHEVLEEAWMGEYGPNRLFLQGLIQAAAALYHVLNANPKGVIKLAEDSAAKLDNYLPSRYGLELEPLVQCLRDYAREAREILGGTVSGFDYDRLPTLTLGRLMRKDKTR